MDSKENKSRDIEINKTIEEIQKTGKLPTMLKINRLSQSDVTRLSESLRNMPHIPFMHKKPPIILISPISDLEFMINGKVVRQDMEGTWISDHKMTPIEHLAVFTHIQNL